MRCTQIREPFISGRRAHSERRQQQGVRCLILQCKMVLCEMRGQLGRGHLYSTSTREYSNVAWTVRKVCWCGDGAIVAGCKSSRIPCLTGDQPLFSKRLCAKCENVSKMMPHYFRTGIFRHNLFSKFRIETCGRSSLQSIVQRRTGHAQ